MKQITDFSDSICIIGGGASGLMAACTALESGVKTVVFEKNRSSKFYESEKFFDNAYLGKKLLITGKGRCNITNNCSKDGFFANVPRNPKFLFAAYNSFTSEDTINFFENIGLKLKTERGNRVFPVSDKSLDVLNSLKNYLKSLGCTFINEEVSDINYENFEVSSIVTSSGKIYPCRNIIICTGGKSYPVTGSSGDGYRFAQKAGHTIISPVPSLVPLVSDDDFCKRLQGLSLKNVKLSLICKKNKKCVFEETGELLFTHFGLSGPLILSASAHIGAVPSDYYVKIDLKPALCEKKLSDRLLLDFEKNKNKEFKNALSGLLPSKLIPVFVQKTEIPPELQINAVTKQQRQKIIETLKEFSVNISGFRPIDEAVITRGGIKTSEINPSTMQSKLVQGLYFAGEVIDVDGYTGGFNLQIAFSTAHLAAKSCAKKILTEV